jgi:hypothetical protein
VVITATLAPPPTPTVQLPTSSASQFSFAALLLSVISSLIFTLL